MRSLAGHILRDLAIVIIDLADRLDPQLPLDLGSLLIPKSDEFTVKRGEGPDVVVRWID